MNSKKPNVPAEVKKTEVPVTTDTLNMMLADSKADNGLNNMTTDDMAIPYIIILQAMSPQCRGETKVQGAEEGDFFNNVSGEIIKGPIKIIPCEYQRSYVEWAPREKGGGFVKQHIDQAILQKTKKDTMGRDVLENGNIIVNTAYHYCLLVKDGGILERVVIAFSSTQMKKSRKWNTQILSRQIIVGGNRITPPRFSHMYDISTVTEKNDKGQWMGFNISNPQLISDKDVYNFAKTFHEEVVKGKVNTAPLSSDVAADIDASNDTEHF